MAELTKQSINYTNRKRDLFINFGADPRYAGVYSVSPSFGQVSAACAGVQKLVQRYMITLLTALESQPAYPTFGTDFMNSLQSCNMMSPADLTHVFNFANLKVLQLFRAYQGRNPDLPEDERINTALLQNFELKDREVVFDIRIITEAGEEPIILIPVPLSIFK